MTTTPSTMASLLAQEEEMNATLQEALSCTTCTLHLTKASMRQDLKTGVYNPLRDPPFSHSHAKACLSEECGDRDGDEDDHGSDYFDSGDSASGTGFENQSGSGCYSGDDEEWDEEGISPLSKPTRKQIPQYTRLITPLQRLSYQSCVSDVLSQGRKQGLELVKPVKSDEEDEDLRFAYYQVDYHIHLHDRARCDMLTLCRDIGDVRQLRGWEIEMKQLDEVEARVVDKSDPTTPVAAATATTPAEAELFTVHQTALWKRRWRLRQRRINDVRRKWAQIMAERKRQREELLLERQKMFRAKVKLYTWKEGDKVLLRELSL
ncbi:uncharacterized protein EURHEDRAFT_374553 [Aspergillus ruber CBS 135680]|uniref:Uncharacterized protein n=1 Tax=Aspergillus ruber (strain CBS 135680) TaxID=1388766 RepID=A0A017SQC5_ASPRC|nr:uncharacterized protein EURHEDRAFT_374553 [Aspergillus ruber CBS 135680]EYE98470.1 hypothetical protein EURHEDRAFT_374553 [Aspergillus ruber CBS 135680]